MNNTSEYLKHEHIIAGKPPLNHRRQPQYFLPLHSMQHSNVTGDNRRCHLTKAKTRRKM